jgi:hypothetical protein
MKKNSNPSTLQIAVFNMSWLLFSTNPSIESLNIHGLRAYGVTNGAAIQAEKLKRQHYSTAYPPIYPRRVITFAIEATGRLGPSALVQTF